MTDSLRVSKGDLVAISVRAKDELNRTLEFLEGRSLNEGESVQIILNAYVTRTATGSLIFGSVVGEATYG